MSNAQILRGGLQFSEREKGNSAAESRVNKEAVLLGTCMCSCVHMHVPEQGQEVASMETTKWSVM